MKFKKLYIVAATVLVVGGVGTGVALAMRPDAPKQQIVDTSASLEPQEQPEEQDKKAPAAVERSEPTLATEEQQDPEPQQVDPTASVEHTFSNNQGTVTVNVSPGTVEPKTVSVFLMVQNGSNHIGSKPLSGSTPVVFNYDYVPSGNELPQGVRVEITDQSGKVYTSEHPLN